MDMFIELIGILFILIAADYKRTGESKINLFSIDCLVQTIFIVAGIILVITSELAQHGLK